MTARRPRVLIVDDKAETAHQLGHVLSDVADVETLAAYPLLEELVGRKAPDVIVTDVAIGDADGLEFCRGVKTWSRTAHIPVVFLTTSDSDDDRAEEQALDAGASDFITSPVNPRILRYRVLAQAELSAKSHLIEWQSARIRQELKVGQKLQRALMPSMPDGGDDFTVAALMRSAHEMSGDFYEVMELDDRHLLVSVGDVSGKGVPAALFMGMSKALISAFATASRSTGEIVADINRHLIGLNHECMFVTLQLAILDRLTGRVQLTNAGHSPAIISRQGGHAQRVVDRHGPPLGIEDVDYSQTEIELEPMESILFYSDGITDARNDGREQFGAHRVIDSVQGKQFETASEMVWSTMYAVDQFAEDTPQFDDITLLALEYRGGDRDRRHGDRFAMSLTASELISAPIGQHVHDFLEPVGLSDAAYRDVRLLLDELLTNSVQHGLHGVVRPSVHVELHVTGENCEITLRDNGVEFDPTRAPPVDIELGLEERDVGGLGVHICRHVADQVSYRRAKGENIVKLTKRFGSAVLPSTSPEGAYAVSS